MLVIEEVCRVTWVQWHRCKAIMRKQRGTAPFPKAAHVALTAQSVPFACDWNSMPSFEADVAAIQVDEGISGFGMCAVGVIASSTVQQTVLWRSLLNAFVGQMSVWSV